MFHFERLRTRKYDVHPESLRRLAIKDGVELRKKKEKLTPTQRKLTSEQLQEVHEQVIEAGMSVRQVAKQVGISRGALVGLLKK